jgi:hypothetical protein
MGDRPGLRAASFSNGIVSWMIKEYWLHRRHERVDSERLPQRVIEGWSASVGLRESSMSS